MQAILSLVLTPVVTYLVSYVANLIRKAVGINDALMAGVIVPVLGGGIAYLGTLAGSSLPWEVGLVVSLASVFLKKLMDSLQAVSQ